MGTKNVGTGDQSVVYRTWLTLTQGGPLNPYAIGLGIATIILVVGLRYLINKYKLPKVDMLVGLLVLSLVAVIFGWSSPQGSTGKSFVSVVGAVPAALPSFHVPDISWGGLSHLLRGALAISFLGLLEALAVAKSIATYTRQPLDYNRQILAEGVGNVIGGFFQSLPGSGSLTRSAINYQSGAITRASGVYSGLIVALVVVLLGPYARFIPKAVLAGLLFITAARLIDWKRLIYAVRASWFDASLVFITAFTAIFISVEDSILVGVAASIILFVPRAARPVIRELIVTSERVVRERLPDDPRDTSLLIYDLEGELFFGAAPELHRYLATILREATRTRIKYVVLRLRRTRHPDAVAVEYIEHFLHDADQAGIVVLLAGLRPDFVKILDNVGLTKWFIAGRIFPEEEQVFSATLRAVRYAYTLIQHDNGAAREPHAIQDTKAPTYYLV